MGRPKTEVPLVKKVAQAFKAVGKLQRAGTNRKRRYPFTRASDVLDAVRLELFNRDVLVLPNDSQPEYVSVGPTNGGEQITECRLAVTYTFKDAKEELPPITINGVGRDVEDKALYKAQTGAQKAMLKRFGLMAEETDDPEWDEAETGEMLDDIAPMHTPSSQKPVTQSQIRAFAEACSQTNKSADEISAYLATEHRVKEIAELRRGKPFTHAIRWASDGQGTLAPKPQAAPALQSKMFPTPAPPAEMRIGNKTVEIPAQKDAYAL